MNPNGQAPPNQATSRPDPAELFAALAAAQGRGDVREGLRLIRERREAGWSVAYLGTRGGTPGGGRP